MFRHLVLVSTLATSALPAAAQWPTGTWPTYGGDPGGMRFSSASQINRSNVNDLRPVWTFHTGALTEPRHAGRAGSFETTPVLFHGALYLTSPFDRVFAVDAATGAPLWSYDPLVDWDRGLGIITSRGVAVWSSPPRTHAAPCADRIFAGTMDARLLALDAATGQPCQDFGDRGSVDLAQGVDFRKGDNYAVTSAPTVLGDVVVVGSAIADNVRVDVELGDVRGFDVHTGKLLWTWEPIPWAKQQRLRTGAANTWSTIAADPEHGLLFLPTSSASPDYFGGLREGDGRDADSLVALDARTGRKVWAFQTVHHNLWDYDLAAEPLLFTFRSTVPAVAIATKTGMVFVFNRLTGRPLYPIEERPVPRSDVPGETASPTQPFSTLPPLSPPTLDTSQPLGLTPADDAACRALLRGKRYDGIFTPPSLQGTVEFPSNVGGVNWGSTAFDPATGILYANTNRIPFLVTLVKRPWIPPGHALPWIILCGAVLSALLLWAAWKLRGGRGLAVASTVIVFAAIALAVSADRIRSTLSHNSLGSVGGLWVAHFGKEYGEDAGAPYALLRQPLETASGHPCSPTPWGTVSALNLTTGQPVWQAPLGTVSTNQPTGTTNVGGPIVTAGGLVFTAAAKDPWLRAFDAATGAELWRGALPATGQATPMTYTLNGHQYIAIAAGGHVGFPGGESDSLVVFALP